MSISGHLHKLSDCAGKSPVSEATRTPVSAWKELQTSVDEMGETLHTTTVAWIHYYSKLYGRVAMKKQQLKKTQLGRT